MRISGLYNKAIEYFNEAAGENLDTKELYLSRGLAYLENNDPVRAGQDWRKVIELDGSCYWLKELLQKNARLRRNRRV